MANKRLWNEAKEHSKEDRSYFCGYDLPDTENWSEKLNFDQIAGILAMNKDVDCHARLLKKMYNFAKYGGIEFDEVERYFSEFTQLLWGASSCSKGSFKNRHFFSVENQVIAKSYSNHSSAIVINALKDIKEGEYIELKNYCGCNCKCTLIEKYHNALPKLWRIEGTHVKENVAWGNIEQNLNFLCHGIPLMTARQCYDFFHSPAVIKAIKSGTFPPINLEAYLEGWWENLELEGNNGAGIIEGNIEANNEQVSIPSINNSSALNADTDINNSKLIKSEKQIIAILKTIKMNQWQPFEVPDGEKSGSIEPICMADYPLLFDGETSFDNAWKAGKKLGLFRMMNDASYAKRGKK